jgi:hypothetical protein
VRALPGCGRRGIGIVAAIEPPAWIVNAGDHALSGIRRRAGLPSPIMR